MTKEQLGLEEMTEKELAEMKIKMIKWKKKGMCGFCGLFNGHNDWCKEKPNA